MTKASPQPKPASPALDNITLAHKEGWQTFINAPSRPRPEKLTTQQLNKLDPTTLAAYNRARREWHANLGPLKTPQLAQLHEDLWDIVDSNLQTGDKAKGAVAIDANPGLGKTTAALSFAKKFHQREIAENGALTAAGNERWPVCRVGLTGNTGMKDLNRAIIDFYAHPGNRRGTTAELAHRALDCVLACETKLLIVDDLHFLRWGGKSGIEVSNHFKYIANEFPVTLIFIGVALQNHGLFADGIGYRSAILAQTGRRTTSLTMDPFTIHTNTERKAWRQLLLGIEQRLVLANTKPGMIADDLSDYLFARSTGHIGSLMTLINRGCQRAIRTGEERLTHDLLDRVKIDIAANTARDELTRALAAKKLTTHALSGHV